jgi:cell division protein FtsA
MAQRRTIVGIDIGSTKIATVVGEHDPARGLVLRGINVVPSEALNRGVVRDLNQAAEDIDTSYSGAMYSSGLNTDQVFVGMTGRDLESVNCYARLAVESPEGEVEQEDVERLLEMALPERLAADRQVVHSMVRQYFLDGLKINRSPAGMIGRSLEVETHVVTGSESQIANIERALSRCELKVRSYVYTLVAAGEAALTAEEKAAGCILIDFGGGTTNVGIFLNGSLTYSACIPVGGQNFDHDLKQGLQVSFEEAQRIKKSYGRAWLDGDGDELDEFVDVKYYGKREFEKVKRRRVYEIMQPRTEEIIEQIGDVILDSGLYERLAGGIVMVGGGSQLRNLRQVLERQFQRKVRLGVPLPLIGHVLDDYRTPAFAPTLGLLLYGMNYSEPQRNAEGSFLGDVMTATGDIFSSFLKVFGRGGEKEDK